MKTFQQFLSEATWVDQIRIHTGWGRKPDSSDLPRTGDKVTIHFGSRPSVDPRTGRRQYEKTEDLLSVQGLLDMTVGTDYAAVVSKELESPFQLGNVVDLLHNGRMFNHPLEGWWVYLPRKWAPAQ